MRSTKIKMDQYDYIYVKHISLITPPSMRKVISILIIVMLSDYFFHNKSMSFSWKWSFTLYLVWLYIEQ